MVFRTTVTAANGVRHELNTPFPAREVRRWWTPRRPVQATKVMTLTCGLGAVAMVAVQICFPLVSGGPASVAGWIGGSGLIVVVFLCRVSPAEGAIAQAASAAGVIWVCACVVQVWMTSPTGTHSAPVAMAFALALVASQLSNSVLLVVGPTCVCAAFVLIGADGEWSATALFDAVLVVLVLALVAGVVAHYASDSERLVNQLASVAAVDGLTGLVTRRVLDDALALALSSAATEAGTALLLADIDEFKKVNDEFGHPGGDMALQHVAAVLQASIRSTDAIISRLGGDEIAVLLPGCASSVVAERAASLVAAVRSRPVELSGGKRITVTISLGAAHAPTDAADVMSLYSAADSALYAAKRGGRDRAVVWEPPCTSA